MNSQIKQNGLKTSDSRRKRTRSQFIKRVQFEDFSSSESCIDPKTLNGLLQEEREKPRQENPTNSSTPFLEDPPELVEKSSFVANFDVILAKEAFYDLRQEARNYLRTTQKLVKSSQSYFEETRKMYSSSMVETIKVPTQDLGCQVDFRSSSVSRDFSSFQEELARLQENCEKFQKTRLEKDSIDLRCTGCLLF